LVKKKKEIEESRKPRATSERDKIIGRRVRARRIEINMSQEYLAEKLKITFQQVQKYEQGINRIAATRLIDIAAALCVNIDYFFEGIAASFESGNEEVRGRVQPLTPQESKLLQIFRLLSSTVKKRVLALATALSAEV
jgi:transcriptional regulator with XRE-family HTH domain